MPATVRVSEVLRRVRLLLQDDAGERWFEPELIYWLNDAQAAIAKYLPPATAQIISHRLRPGPLQSLDRIAAGDYRNDAGLAGAAPLQGTSFLKPLCNMGAEGTTPGHAVRIVESGALDSQNPLWQTAAQAKAVVKVVAFDPMTPRHFHVWPPVPATGAVWLRYSLNALPARIADGGPPGSEVYQPSNTTTIGIGDENLDEIVHYIVARANMKDVEFADSQKAATFASLFTSSLNARAEQLLGVNPNLKLLPFAPQPIAAAS